MITYYSGIIAVYVVAKSMRYTNRLIMSSWLQRIYEIYVCLLYDLTVSLLHNECYCVQCVMLGDGKIIEAIFYVNYICTYIYVTHRLHF